MRRTLTTLGGRPILILGNADVVSLDRWNALSAHLDSDPRIATCSVVADKDRSGSIRHAQSPGGTTVLVALDVVPLVGDAPEGDDPQTWASWFTSVRDRGLRHDHWCTDDVDIAAAPWGMPGDDSDGRDPASAAAYAGVPEYPPRLLTICVDATWLGPFETGAQVLMTHAVDALVHNPRISKIHLVNIEQLPSYARHLEAHEAVVVGPPDVTTDVIWFPNQIDARIDVTRTRKWARRSVCTYLDFIAYDIPRYHMDEDAWVAYRQLQRSMALVMDGITTISHDVADRLLEEVPALERQRVRAIPLGLDHLAHMTASPPTDPEIVAVQARLEQRPFILVLGNDFTHKNRDFAIRVWERLLEQGHVCDLVLAGLHVRGSSSQEAEDRLRARHTDLRGRVITVDHVSGATRSWLLRHAAAVHYPSSAEGFGFVPYEAAALGTPVTFTSFGPLREISGVLDVPRSWDLEAHAEDLVGLLTEKERRQQRVNALLAPAQRLTWTRYAKELSAFFLDIIMLPPAPAGLTMQAPHTSTSAVVRGRSRRALSRARRAARRIRGSRP